MSKTPTLGETADLPGSAGTASQLRRRLDVVVAAAELLLEEECGSLSPEQTSVLEDVHRNATEMERIVEAELESASDGAVAYRGVAYGGFEDDETERNRRPAERRGES